MSSPIFLAHNYHTAFTIRAGSFTRAAEIFASYLKKITGAIFPIRSYASDPCIYLKQEDCGTDGFRYRMANGNLYFIATDEQAAVYAVYDFLERIVGCRYYTSREEYIPFDANLSVCFEDYQYTPPLLYRELFYQDFSNPFFSEKHKMHPMSESKNLETGKTEEVHNTGRGSKWGFWCHSFQYLCDPDTYFEEHPEYFSLRDGKRIGKNSQLCLSNPDVLRVVTENLKKCIDKNPEALYWSVSQNDNDCYCQCENCKALDEKDGGPMGSLLTFVNQVADQFPDKIISTLAYWYSRKPPAITRPHKNVHIMLCNIEANRGRPIEEDPLSEESKNELLAWKEICSNVFLWDYNIQFRNLVSPFPNLYVLAPNIQFFIHNHVTSLFSQCNREWGGEFSELRGYLLAKLMWNPNADTQQLIREFVLGYYRQGGPQILEYISRIHTENTSGALNIFGGPENGRDSYLSEQNVRIYLSLFEEALHATEHDEEAAFRIRTARLPLLYACISLRYGTKEEQLSWITEFASQARHTGLEKVEEWTITVDRFITDALASVQEQTSEHFES